MLGCVCVSVHLCVAVSSSIKRLVYMALSQENDSGEELVVCSFQREQPLNAAHLNLAYRKFRVQQSHFQHDLRHFLSA